MSRIIAGHARGRRISVPDHVTRPTSDRAREGLFSSLEARFGLAGEKVLDLFAGSGALGLEALSRGAQRVTLVDSLAAAVETIKSNAQTLGMPGVEVVQAKAGSFLATVPTAAYSMVLADPPYEMADDAVRELVRALIPALEQDAVVVVERNKATSETDWPEGFEPTGQKLKKRTFGIARFDMAIWRGGKENQAHSDGEASGYTGAPCE